MSAARVQLRRTKGWRIPPNTVVVSRPSKWGNPHPVGFCGLCGVTHTRTEAVDLFRCDAVNLPVEQLRGKNLGCWCKLDDACHADVLLELANEITHP